MLVKVANKDTESVVSGADQTIAEIAQRTLPVADLGQRQRARRSSAPDLGHRGRGSIFVTLGLPGSSAQRKHQQIACANIFPRGTDLSLHSQAKLSAIARQLDERPRKTLLYQTRADKFAECVASDQLNPPRKADIRQKVARGINPPAAGLATALGRLARRLCDAYDGLLVTLLFSVAITRYIPIGIQLEERNLVQQFGDQYRTLVPASGPQVRRSEGRRGADVWRRVLRQINEPASFERKVRARNFCCRGAQQQGTCH